MRLRRIAKETVYGLLAVAGAPRRLEQRRGAGLTVLTYHSIGPTGEYPYLNRMPPARFTRQMRYLARHYEVVDCMEGLARLEARQATGPMVAVTIDDGYADNFEHAWPALQDAGVPATIFLATDYLDKGRMPWPTQVSALLHHATRQTLELADMDVLPLRTPKERSAAGHVLRQSLSRLDQPKRDRVLARMAEALAPRDMRTCPPLSWDNVRRMQRDGVRFGAHTRYHAWLDRVGPEEQMRELRYGKKRIETELGVPCDIIAYPNGNHDATVRAAAETAGYRFALTQDRGVNRAGTVEPYALRRVEVPFDEHLNTFICRTAGVAI